MGIPVFDIKTDASAPLFKQGDGAGKTAPGDFTKIFDGCVSGCVEAKDSSVKAPAKAADIPALTGQGVFDADAMKVGVAANSATAVEVEVSSDGVTTSPSVTEPSVTEVVAGSLPFDPLAMSPEHAVDTTATVKTARITEKSADNPVITEKGVQVPSLETVILQPVTERASCQAPTQDSSELNSNPAVTPAVELAASTQVATIDGASEAATVTKQITATDSKALKTQKPAKPQETATAEKDDAQPPAGVLPFTATPEKPSEKPETIDVKAGDTAKASRKANVEKNAATTAGDEKPEGVVTAPAISNGASRPDASAAIKKEADPSPSIPAIRTNAKSNSADDKITERPAVAAGETSKATGTATAGQETLPIDLADPFLAPVKEITSAPVKASDIKSTKAAIGSEQKEPDTVKTPREADATVELKPTVKPEVYAPDVKKAQAPAVGLPSGGSAQSVSETTVQADDKGEAAKPPSVHAQFSFAERLRADNATPAPSEATGPEVKTTAVPVSAASWSEGFEDGHERAGDGKEDRKEGLSRFENATGSLQAGPEARSSRFAQPVIPQKQTEAVRPEAVFEKLDAGVKMSLGKGGKEVSLSLSPEHLGQIHIRLNIDETTVKARIVVESDAARAILETDSGKLKEVFARQGLALDKYTIELGAGNTTAGGGFTDGGARENSFGRPSSWTSTAARDEETLTAKNYAQRENMRRPTGGVDLFA